MCVRAYFLRQRRDKFLLIRLRRPRRCWDLINGRHRFDPILISGRNIISNGVPALIENSAALDARGVVELLYICPGGRSGVSKRLIKNFFDRKYSRYFSM